MNRWLLRGTLLLLAICLLVAAAMVLFLQTGAFHAHLRKAIVEEAERASGGRVELGALRFTLRDLKIGIDDFTLHGKEPAGEQPLLHLKSAEVELHLTSLVSRAVDVRSIRLVEPRLHITADEHGDTNLPEPKIRRQPKQDFVDTLLDLKAASLEVVNGSLAINDKRIPLDLKASSFAAAFRYENAKPRYAGSVSFKDLVAAILNLHPLRLSADADVALEHGRVLLSRAVLKTGSSDATVSGFVYDLMNPSTEFGVAANVAMADLARAAKIPLDPVGAATFAGRVSLHLGSDFRYDLSGVVKGRGLGFRQGHLQIRDASISAALLMDKRRLQLSNLRLQALGGNFSGGAFLHNWDAWTLDGFIEGFHTSHARFTEKPLPLAGIASGSVHAEGSIAKHSLDAARAQITITPGPEGRAVQGSLQVTYRSGTVEFANSYLSTPASEVVFHGALDSRIHVGARSSDLAADVQPFLSEPLPVQLRNGSISFDGFLAGSTAQPQIFGKVLAHNVVYDNQLVDRLNADIELDSSRLRVRNARIDQGRLHLTGEGAASLSDWKLEAGNALQATIDLRGARIERLLQEADYARIPITGAINLTARLKGSRKALDGEALLTADDVVAFGEPLERVKGALKLTANTLEMNGGEALLAKTRIPFSIRYARSGADWNTGVLHWRAQGSSVDLASIRNFKSRIRDLAGTASILTSGEGLISNKTFQLRFLQGDINVPDLTYRNSTVGNLQLRAATKGSSLGVTGRALFQGARLRLNGEWEIDEPDIPGEGSIAITGASLESLMALFSKAGPPLPFQSAVEGEASFKVSLLNVERTFESNLLLRRIQLNPDPRQILRAGAREQDLVITNLRPVVIRVDPREAVISSAQFIATNTRFNLMGRAGFGEKAGWDLRLAGSVNLAELQILHRDLLASGLAHVDATVRGALDNPMVNGTLQLENASLYFGDLPTGVDNVNGSVHFDRNRATVQSLTGESGGGKFTLGGFVGFGVNALVYRLQAAANGVRVRYPEGASTTVNANLSLTGTSEDSLLAGVIRIVRAGFNPRTDFASILADAAKSNAPAPATSNEYLRGMQFDLKIESGPNLEFQTSLTRGLHAEVDLRLRGNLARPSLLGAVAFTDGEISLFGNQYTLNRGDVRFFNPTQIEPTFDLEAQTRARGITVNVSFTGTPRKINAAYRSDPPLQPSEIIALLAIGRDPNIGAGLATSQSNTQSTLQGVGSLVGEAVAQSLNGRLQKFFGVSRIKIDPQLTGVENIPQARLTLEQQVSKDITLTYITNLARTQEQIVRIQWDLSRQWSAIAVREENGLFGVDFQFRKRFK